MQPSINSDGIHSFQFIFCFASKLRPPHLRTTGDVWFRKMQAADPNIFSSCLPNGIITGVLSVQRTCKKRKKYLGLFFKCTFCSRRVGSSRINKILTRRIQQSTFSSQFVECSHLIHQLSHSWAILAFWPLIGTVEVFTQITNTDLMSLAAHLAGNRLMHCKCGTKKAFFFKPRPVCFRWSIVKNATVL